MYREKKPDKKMTKYIRNEASLFGNRKNVLTMLKAFSQKIGALFFVVFFLLCMGLGVNLQTFQS